MRKRGRRRGRRGGGGREALDLKTTLVQTARGRSPGDHTCACIRGAPSAADSLPWNAKRPHSGSPTSAASQFSPSCSEPSVLGWAGERRTGASPQSFWPSTAGGLEHCGQNQCVGWVSGQCGRKVPPYLTCSLGSQTRWRFPRLSSLAVSWKG